VRRTPTPGAILDQAVSVLNRQVLGLYAGTAAALIMFWGLSRSALWLDESASAVATQRSWPHLWRLLQGTDAPLVPYYILLKAQKDAALLLFPGAGSHLEALLRWPSAVAIAVACWVLVSWLRTAGSDTVAVASGAVLLLVEGVSRYGQEARPYGLVLMLAIITTALWWRLMRNPVPPAAVAYGVAVALLAGLHALAAPLVLAQLVAALIIRPGALFERILLSGCGALSGLLVASPFTIAALVQGGGATRFPQLTGPHLLGAFLSLFDGRRQPDPHSLIIIALAAVGLIGWNSPRYADLTRVAACWAVIPVLVLIPMMAQRPNLLLARYVLFVVPGWVILAGLGVSLMAEALARNIDVHWYAVASSVVVVLVTVLLVAAGQWPALNLIRTPSGHGESILPALAFVDLEPYRALPVVITSQYGAIEFGAYASADALRVLNFRQQTDQPDIWPLPVDRPLIQQKLRSIPALVVLVRSGKCGSLPSYLNRFQVSLVRVVPGEWTFYYLRQVMPVGRTALPGWTSLTGRGFRLPDSASGARMSGTNRFLLRPSRLSPRPRPAAPVRPACPAHQP
jgi:mannosyltransferase